MKKLTMVSCIVKSKRVTKFVMLPVHKDGKVRAPVSLYQQMAAEILGLPQCPAGVTLVIGG